MRALTRVVLVFMWAVVVPASAYAQATLAGVVKDSSGGVLPGATVEASSPALIERTRSAVTDGNGLYQIVDLRPGTYAVTFSLTGFSTVKREAIEVTGAGVLSINAEMRVGSVTETITVSGETPIVDTQSTRRQAVLDGQTVTELPVARGYANLLATIPSIQVTIGPQTSVAAAWYTAHGGRGNEGRIQLGGLNVGGAAAGGGSTGFAYDTSNAQEIQFTISGGLGDTDIGGPVMNIIPREGGNNFAGTLFGSASGKWAQANNLDDELRSYGITEPASLIKNFDTSAAVGGPIVRSRLWFYANARDYTSQSDVRALYGNKYAGDPTKWTYLKDDGLKARSMDGKTIGSARLTSQLTPRNKVGFYYDYQSVCGGSSFVQNADGACLSRGSDWVALGSLIFGGTSPESASVWDSREKIIQATWSSPITNKLLLEAGYSTFISTFGGQDPVGALTNLIQVTEQTANATTGVPVGNFVYRALDSRSVIDQAPNTWRASATYVTGAHNMKFGTQGTYNITENLANAGDTRMAYRFNTGVPNQFTMRLAPVETSNRSLVNAFYAQDQWTVRRLTLQGAVRYEHASSWFPAEHNGVSIATRFNAAPISFGRLDGVTGYNDISPRVGAVWDAFGHGKTALKVNLGKYLQAVTNEGNYTVSNKAQQLQSSTNRSWTDANGNYATDCDLSNPVQQDNRLSGGDFCGGWSNLNFGSVFNLTQVNPAVLSGWGVRSPDWQFGASIQQEILPRVSLEVGYNRRWFSNFFYTDNLAVGPADYTRVTVTAPPDARLPDGGGFPVTFVTINPDKFGQTQNYYTFASDYGNDTRYWHGVDTTVNARLMNGLVLQGGTSTGRGVRDNCDITAKLPELLLVVGTNSQVNACHVTEKWLTTVRGLASYTVPKIDVLVSAIMRFQPNASVPAASTTVATNGVALSANYVVSNATIQQIIGRPLAGGSQNATVNLLLPGELYPDRINNIDLRFAKTLRFGRTKSNIGIDLYNLVNSNTPTGFDATYGATWLRPTGVQSPRFARFNVTVDF